MNTAFLLLITKAFKNLWPSKFYHLSSLWAESQHPLKHKLQTSQLFFFGFVLTCQAVDTIYTIYTHLCHSVWKAEINSPKQKQANMLSWDSARSVLKGQFTHFTQLWIIVDNRDTGLGNDVIRVYVSLGVETANIHQNTSMEFKIWGQLIMNYEKCRMQHFWSLTRTGD